MTSLRSFRSASVGLALVAALGLSACGSDDEGDDKPETSASATTADDDVEAYLDDVLQALLEEDVVAVSGAGEDDGEAIEVDLAYDGPDMTGRFVSGGMGFTILSSGGTVYFQPDDGFWTEQIGVPAEALGQVSGRWLLIDPEDPDLGEIAEFAEREAFLEDLLDPEGEVTFGEPEEIDGTEYDVLVSDASEDGGSLFVDPETKLPLKLESTGDLAFTYDDVTIPAPPPADQQITLADLEAMLG